MTSKHPLRKSCAFCRARKIKCSNETICEACRKQGADCIYDFESPRPRCRSVSHDRSGSSCSGRPDESSSRRRTPVVGLSVNDDQSMEQQTNAENMASVAQVLEQRFSESVSAAMENQANVWQHRTPACCPSTCQLEPEMHKGTNAKLGPRMVKQKGILPLLATDLLGLLVHQHGSLGCRHVEEGGAGSFTSGLANDGTQTMFDDTFHGSNVLSEYSQRQQTQLIDVWFSVHPLSFLVSKTLLLRELRDGTHDEVLVATMLADANFSMGEEVATTRGHVLLRWATAQLWRRPLRFNSTSEYGEPQYSGIATRVFSEISTSQALMLLAWNALSCSQVRRASCYLSLAGRIAAQIREQMSDASTSMSSSRINGIDVFDVEQEVVAYLYWTTYSLSLWASVQTGWGFALDLSPSPLTIVSLPVTEASSVMIQLDVVSDNFSTLPKQKSVLRDMWPLAQIASIVAHIIFLHHRQGVDAAPAFITSPFHQKSPLLASHSNQQKMASQDKTALCLEISTALAKSIQALSGQVADSSSKSLVLLAHHILAMHFLLPPSPQGRPDLGLVGPEQLDHFCALAETTLQIFASESQQSRDSFSATFALLSCLSDLFCLVLDTCARVIDHICAVKGGVAILSSCPIAYAYDCRLRDLTADLYAMSKDDFLNQGSFLRTVRKQLRRCCKALGACQISSPFSGTSSLGDSSRSATSSPVSLLLHASPHPIVNSDADSVPTAVGETLASFGSSAATSSSPLAYPLLSSSDFSSRDGIAYASAEEFAKPEWNTVDELFHSTLGPAGLTSPSTMEHYSGPNVVEMNGSFYTHTPALIHLDTGAGAMAGVRWGWPEAGAEPTHAADMDTFMYYDNTTHKQPM